VSAGLTAPAASGQLGEVHRQRARLGRNWRDLKGMMADGTTKTEAEKTAA
jgi:hypothetical protein